MFTTFLVTAIVYTAITVAAGACLGFWLGRLAAWPTVTQLRAQLADARWQLAHDPLTGLHNRRGLRTVHFGAMASNVRQPIIAVLLDLDGFKDINDTYGHNIGDEVLIQIADRLAHTAALYGGIMARHSGDEYAALFPVRGYGITAIADALLSTVAAPVEVLADGLPVRIATTASVGVAVVDSTDPLEATALHRADVAMYHAKRAGGNQHELYTHGMSMPTREPRRGPRLRDMPTNHSEVDA